MILPRFCILCYAMVKKNCISFFGPPEVSAYFFFVERVLQARVINFSLLLLHAALRVQDWLYATWMDKEAISLQWSLINPPKKDTIMITGAVITKDLCLLLTCCG